MMKLAWMYKANEEDALWELRPYVTWLDGDWKQIVYCEVSK